MSRRLIRIARSAIVLTAVLATAAPINAFAADTGNDPVGPPPSVAAPLTLGSATTTAAPAGGTKPAAAKPVDGLLADARTAIAAKKWVDALATLKLAAAADPKNADVQNLLGYATRNNGDAKGSLAYYDAALALNPQHTGALEYQGVAFVKLGQTAKAKANLARLKTICGVSCEEYKDLAAALRKPVKKK